MNEEKIRICSVGKYVPKTTLTNEDLTQWLDTSDEWISTRTGIKKRRISLTENTSDLCVQAAHQILERVNLVGSKVGLIIVATMTPDFQSPSVASQVQAAIGANEAMAFDVNAACSGFIYASSIAEKMLRSMSFDYALVIGGEVMSKVIDWTDRSTAVLFGDGASGVLLEKNTEHHQFIGEDINTDGSRGKALRSGEVGIQNPLIENPTENPYLQMDGREIFDFVIKAVPETIRNVVGNNEMTVDDVDYFLLHQANERLIKTVAKKLKLPLTRFPINISSYGNTSAASLPILLEELVEEGTIQFGSGQTIVLCGFGGGLTWGSLLLKL